ncbi:MAG: 50S ribosomal protein L25 [Candidatus Niyogibacteria bacterium]|nr:50S ribosomal protein L25 [Candidatus Niyogibacteria bacterium]
MLITAQKREITGKKVAGLRAKGLLPAVLYGWGEKTPRLLTVEEKAFRKAWKEAGEASIIDLEVNGENKGVLIQDVAFDPRYNTPLHVDFYAVQMDKPLAVTVPLVFEGESGAVKNLGATLVKVAYEIEVEALPKNLPHNIKVDLSKLAEIDSRILVGDLELPAGVSVNAPADDVVAVAQAHVEEVVTATERTLEDIEVAEKGKKPEEGEEGAAEAAK